VAIRLPLNCAAGRPAPRFESVPECGCPRPLQRWKLDSRRNVAALDGSDGCNESSGAAWQNRAAYDEKIYEAALRKSHSPIVPLLDGIQLGKSPFKTTRKNLTKTVDGLPQR
jgi:hypothetical protein